jgi:hypothetical protein
VQAEGAGARLLGRAGLRFRLRRLLAHQLRDGAGGAGVVLFGGGDESGKPGGDAARGEVARHTSEAVGVGLVYVHAERAVDVDVDEAGEQSRPVEVDDAGVAGGGRFAFVDDGLDA